MEIDATAANGEPDPQVQPGEIRSFCLSFAVWKPDLSVSAMYMDASNLSRLVGDVHIMARNRSSS
jgi:hypothetical protein